MGYEKTCGDRMPTPVFIGGAGDLVVPFFVTGGDHTTGGTANQIIDPTTLAGAEYIPAHLSDNGTFMIIIEVAAPIVVQLFDNSDFTISQAMADAYLGSLVPMALRKVYKAGSTGKFSAVR